MKAGGHGQHCCSSHRCPVMLLVVSKVAWQLACNDRYSCYKTQHPKLQPKCNAQLGFSPPDPVGWRQSSLYPHRVLCSLPPHSPIDYNNNFIWTQNLHLGLLPCPSKIASSSLSLLPARVRHSPKQRQHTEEAELRSPLSLVFVAVL